MRDGSELRQRSEQIDRFTPRYFAIEQSLRSRISSLKAHDSLPSEAELCIEFNVSRMTARAAIQKLVQDGLVYRESGRGTFVAPPIVDRQLSNLRGFSAEMTARGLTPSSTVLASSLTDATLSQAEALGVEIGAQVVMIRRVRRADTEPLVLDTATLTSAAASVLHEDLESGSLHRALVAENIVPTSGTSEITAELATADDSTHLHVAIGSPLLVERRLIRDQENQPMEWTESRYVPSRYNITAQFTVELPSG